MFDRTIILPRPHTEYVTRNVNVTEHRAPTDESVRLLSEMEGTARKRIIERYVSEAGENTLGAVETWESCDDMRRYVAFTLNGRKVHVRVDPKRDVHAMVDELAREIAVEIVCMVNLRRVL